jgi:hypothetical protein
MFSGVVRSANFEGSRDNEFRNLPSQSEDSILSKIQFPMSAIYGISDFVLKVTPSGKAAFLRTPIQRSMTIFGKIPLVQFDQTIIGRAAASLLDELPAIEKNLPTGYHIRLCITHT